MEELSYKISQLSGASETKNFSIASFKKQIYKQIWRYAIILNYALQFCFKCYYNYKKMVWPKVGGEGGERGGER